METRYCPRCEETKPRSDFYDRMHNGKIQAEAHCKNCKSQQTRQRRMTVTGRMKFIVNSMKKSSPVKKRGLPMEITWEDLVELWNTQEGKCAVTGIQMDLKSGRKKGGVLMKNPLIVSPDRIDSSKGYTKDNIRLVTWWANAAMNDVDDEFFVEMCENVISHMVKKDTSV